MNILIMMTRAMIMANPSFVLNEGPVQAVDVGKRVGDDDDNVSFVFVLS